MIHSMEGQHHPLLITLCSLFTIFYHNIIALCNLYIYFDHFFGSNPSICHFSIHRRLPIFQQRDRILHTKFNLTLGLPLHFSCGRLCVLHTFLHSQWRFQKQWSKMRTTRVPPPLPSTPLQMTHSNTWPELLVMSFFKLTNFCFWHGKNKDCWKCCR